MSLTSRRTAMARKRYKPEEIVAKLRQVDVLVSQGQNMMDAIRQIGVSEVPYCRWRQQFGWLKAEQWQGLQEPELENSRRRKAVSDLTLDKVILQEAARGNFARGSSKARGEPKLDGVGAADEHDRYFRCCFDRIWGHVAA